MTETAEPATFLYRRNGVWYCRIQRGGADYRKTLRTRDLAEAKYRLALEMQKLTPPTTPQGRASFVYFIGADDGPIKIGTTGDPDGRLAMMRIGSPMPLAILALAPGDAATERRYHRRFAAHRLHGEWFARHPDILAEIVRLTPPQRGNA